jgi:hypothetical protein
MRHVLIPTVLLLSAALSVQAQEPDQSETAFALHGFGTLGYASSSNNKAEFLRDLSQPTGVGTGGGAQIDSILGVQANWRISESLEFAAQAVSHQRYDDTFDPEVTWALLKYELNPRVSFRVGRIGTEFLMQSDSHMVGYSYLPVRPPVNFYGLVPINYGDGADVQVRLPLTDGVLKGRLYLGEARENLPPYDVKGSPIRGASIGYEKGALRFRLIHAESDLANSEMGLAPLRDQLNSLGAVAAANAMDMKGTRSSYDSIGLAWDDGSWQLQAALNAVVHGTVLTENSRAGYISVARRIGNLNPYAAYSWAQSTAKSLSSGLSGPAAAAMDSAIASVLKRSHQDQQTTTVGMRWDFARNFDLKAQLDFVEGDATSFLLYDHVQSGWDGRTTVFSLAMDFVF